MKKVPDYISQIERASNECALRVSIEERLLDRWHQFEKLCEQRSYDILAPDDSDARGPERDEEFRSFMRGFISLLYELVPGTPARDCAQIREKDEAYGGSWHRRGGTGAFHALARKGDRLVSQLEKYKTLEACRLGDESESIDDTLGDLRRYLILIEAWRIARNFEDNPF